MTIKEIIDELKKLGYEVTYRKRTDGGYLIKEINNMTFTGSKGNAYARRVLGVELSQARIEQTSFNVGKYIQKEQLDPELKNQLKRVQRKWRKNDVHAKLTTKKVRRHVETSGKAEAKEYLSKMDRYGQGLAYLDNVEWLAQYYEDLARGSILDDQLQTDLFNFATTIRAKAEVFKEEWINRLYRCAYDIREAMMRADTQKAKSLLDEAKSIIV